MKKYMLLVLSIIIVMLLAANTSCRKMTLDDFTWTKLEGSGTYSSQTNESTIKLYGVIQLNQPNIADTPLTGTIESWSFGMGENANITLVISKTTYSLILGETALVTTSNSSSSELWVRIETLTPIKGDIFNGKTPDTLQLAISITDNKNNIYNEAAQATFTCQRN